MLNIPKEVQELFRQNSVKKNLRISFPNGEREDIVNENIISESMTFTESISSQENLIFGLIESPVLEFETVGVDNIKGMEIEAEIDVDVTTTPTASMTIPLVDRKATFEILCAGDVTFYGYHLSSSANKRLRYQIELVDDFIGDVFPSQFPTMDSEDIVGGQISEIFCVLLLGASSYYKKRIRITATVNDDAEELCVKYATNLSSADLGYEYYPIQLGRFIVDSCPRQSDMTRRSVIAYGKSYTAINKFSPIESAKRRVTTNKKNDYVFDIEKFVLSNMPGDYKVENASYEECITFTSSGTFDSYLSVSSKVLLIETEEAEKSLYYQPCTMTEEEVSVWKQRVENLIKDYSFPDYPDWMENVMQIIDSFSEEIFYSTINYHGVGNYSFTGSLKGGYRYIYPYNNSGISYADYGSIRIPVSITILSPYGEDVATFTINENPKLYEVIFENPLNIEMSIKRVKEGSYYTVSSQEPSVADAIQGYLELQGRFGMYDRNGSFNTLKLSDNFKTLNGGSISKSDYKSLWYEDKKSYPYGMVSVTFKNRSNEDVYMVYNIPKGISRENVLKLKEESSSREVYFQWLNVSTGTMLPESGHLMIEAPYPIESVLIGFDYYGLPLEFEGDPNIVEISSDNFYFPDITDIQVVLKAQESYSGNVVLSSYEPVEEYYKADESIQYDLSNNFLVQNVTFAESQVEEILRAFANNIKDIQYVPCEVELVGLPYVEAGDVVEVETDSGNFTTLVGRRTISGIQALFDSWESKATETMIVSGSSPSYGVSIGGGGEIGGAVISVNGYVGNVVLKTSDLVNDSNYVSDSDYVHTDNNYTTEEKDKLESIEEDANNYELPVASNTLGGVRTTSTVNSSSGYTPCPIIGGVPYYKEGEASGGGDTTIRYNTETDWVQLFVNNVWQNWQKAGLLVGWIYNVGVQSYPMDATASNWKYNSSYSNNAGTFNSTSITLATAGTTQTSIVGTVEKISVTGYKKLCTEIVWNNTTNELEVNISDVNGDYYVGAMVRVGSGTTYIHAFLSTDKTNLENTIIKRADASATNSTARRTATVNKIWLE